MVERCKSALLTDLMLHHRRRVFAARHRHDAEAPLIVLDLPGHFGHVALAGDAAHQHPHFGFANQQRWQGCFEFTRLDKVQSEQAVELLGGRGFLKQALERGGGIGLFANGRDRVALGRGGIGKAAGDGKPA